MSPPRLLNDGAVFGMLPRIDFNVLSLFIHLTSNRFLPLGLFSLASDAGSTASSTVCYYTEHQH